MNRKQQDAALARRLAAKLGTQHIHWPDRIGPDVRCVICGARVTKTGTVIEPLR